MLVGNVVVPEEIAAGAMTGSRISRLRALFPRELSDDCEIGATFKAAFP
jgi:hypothetical protein